MEFHIQTQGVQPDLAAINAVIDAVDPMAVVDLDATGTTLMIAVGIESDELIGLLATAGFPVAPRQVRQLPSICCGDCSG